MVMIPDALTAGAALGIDDAVTVDDMAPRFVVLGKSTRGEASSLMVLCSRLRGSARPVDDSAGAPLGAMFWDCAFFWWARRWERLMSFGCALAHH